MKMKSAITTLVATVSVSLSGTVFAASGTASFDVSVQVLASCSISATNMSFASITTGTTSNTDATSTLTVNCSNGTPFTIALGNGTNYSGGRRMTNGTTNINYYLYSDSGRSTLWGGATLVSGTGTGSDQTFNVYGRVPAGQSVIYAGNYIDTITATITY